MPPPGEDSHNPENVILLYTGCLHPNAFHRVAADGISPEQAVDEAIALIKQILAE
jgi:hypothetical protein